MSIFSSGVLQAFVNEKAAPDILEYEGDLVSRLQDQIQNQVHLTPDANLEAKSGRPDICAPCLVAIGREQTILQAIFTTTLHSFLHTLSSLSLL
jgi:hypothetical protein